MPPEGGACPRSAPCTRLLISPVCVRPGCRRSECGKCRNWTDGSDAAANSHWMTSLHPFVSLGISASLCSATWLTGAFSLADILMSDGLRLVDRFDGLAKPAVPMLNVLWRDPLSRRPCRSDG